ncbi:MAG: ADP-ribosylation factor-like protein [Promethearchaeota archaeon]
MSIPHLEIKRKEAGEIEKILFTGLDNAGKTTIIYALQREFSKIALLRPTRGAQRRVFDFLGKEIGEWDLGGQLKYRISYLKNPNKYFDKTSICIYVIDILAKSRYRESVDYLKEVIKKFEEFHISPPVYVLLHKYDPALIKSAANRMKTLEQDIKTMIKKELTHDKIFFYNTTIFDLPHIFHVMSEIYLNLYPKSELIDKLIKEFAIKIFASGVEIIDNNSLIIGSNYDSEETKTLISRSTPYFLTLNESFKRGEGLGINAEERNHILVQRFQKYFIFKEISLGSDSSPYYLLILKNNPNFNIEDFESLSSLLKEILYK